MPLIVTDNIPPEMEGFFQIADAMREIMNLDLEECEIAKQVWAFDGGNMDTQSVVWELLTPPERRAWMAYRQLWWDMDLDARGHRDINWRRK